MKKSVIIVAAGNSSRLGLNKSKLFLKLNGKCLIDYSLEKFSKIKDTEEVIIATNDIEETEKVVDKNLYNFKLKIVLGGSTRQESVLNAFSEIKDKNGLVLIHDVARPLFLVDEVEKCIENATEYGASILASRVVDTIKKVELGETLVDETLNRDELYQAQTPQIFKYDVLKYAYENADLENIVFTDESSLVEHIGMDVVLTESSRENIKITYPEDLKIAEAIAEIVRA